MLGIVALIFGVLSVFLFLCVTVGLFWDAMDDYYFPTAIACIVSVTIFAITFGVWAVNADDQFQIDQLAACKAGGGAAIVALYRADDLCVREDGSIVVNWTRP